MLHVLEINSREELAGYRLLWKSLLMQTRGATFLQSLEWLETHWRHAGQNEHLRVLVAYADGRPLGILPLVVRTARTWLGALRVLTWPVHSAATTFAPIGSNPTATLLAALGHLRRGPRDWDVIDLPGVDRFGIDQGRVERALAATGFAPRVTTTERTAVVELYGTCDDYWSARDARWREYVARNEKLLARGGRVEFVRCRPEGAACGDGDPRWELSLACEPLIGQFSAETSESTAAQVDWRRDAVRTAARAGGLDLAAMLVNGYPVAASWNVHYQGHVAQLQSGFSAAAARADAGCVLLARMIADSFERGDRVIALAPGRAAFQQPWQTGVARSCRCTHVAAGAWRARLGYLTSANRTAG